MTVNHRTWRDRVAPLGAWSISRRTNVILVVEGLFDMLIGAQTIVRKTIPIMIFP